MADMARNRRNGVDGMADRTEWRGMADRHRIHGAEWRTGTVARNGGQAPNSGLLGRNGGRNGGQAPNSGLLAAAANQEVNSVKSE